jgi:hypothetical protein
MMMAAAVVDEIEELSSAGGVGEPLVPGPGLPLCHSAAPRRHAATPPRRHAHLYLCTHFLTSSLPHSSFIHSPLTHSLTLSLSHSFPSYHHLPVVALSGGASSLHAVSAASLITSRQSQSQSQARHATATTTSALPCSRSAVLPGLLPLLCIFLFLVAAARRGDAGSSGPLHVHARCLVDLEGRQGRLRLRVELQHERLHGRVRAQPVQQQQQQQRGGGGGGRARAVARRGVLELVHSVRHPVLPHHRSQPSWI